MFASRSVRHAFHGVKCQPFTRPRFQPKPTFARTFRTQSPFQQYYRDPRYTYSRFQQTKGLFQWWLARPTFYYQVGGIALAVGGFYTYNLETVPVSGRRRFNFISPETEVAISQQQFGMIMEQFKGQIVSEWDPRARKVKRVLERLIPSSGLHDVDWEVFVVQSEEKNAFVIPGGKVFVFTGILPLCGDDDGIAAVLGHEIAHTVAHHAAERMSRYNILTFFAVAASALLGAGDIGNIGTQMLLQLAFELPNGRAQEAEADYIGLMMMAQSCYNPHGAVSFWERMVKAEKVAPPEFISTHPSSGHRVEKLKEWLPEAEQKRSDSNCGGVLDYADDFRRAFPTVKW